MSASLQGPGDSDRRSLARLHREHRHALRSLRSKAWDWYQTYEPLDRSFWVAWRRVPEILQSLQALDGLDDVGEAELHVIAWIGSALTVREPDRVDLDRPGYLRARRALQRAVATLEDAYEAIQTQSPAASLELLKATQRLHRSGELLVTQQHQLDSSARIAGRLRAGGGQDMLTYLLMRVLLGSGRLTKARAEVLVARMGSVFGWEVDYRTKKDGRDESPAIRKRVERFRASSKWWMCPPWQVLLWDLLGIEPDEFGEDGPPAPNVRDPKALQKLASTVDSRDRYLDAIALLKSLKTLEGDVESLWAGFDCEFDNLDCEIRACRSRMDSYQEKLLQGLHDDPKFGVLLRQAEDEWAEEQKKVEYVCHMSRLAARALKQPEDDYQLSDLSYFPMDYLERLAVSVRRSRKPAHRELKKIERCWRAEKDAIEAHVKRQRILDQALGLPANDRPAFPTSLGLRTFRPEE